MPDSFRQIIQQALSDPQLQAALDANAERRQTAFTTAFESLPESRQALREHAHAMRADVIENLDAYLEQFVNHASANGIQVHNAQDGSQAVEIVLEIARQSGQSLIAKSKTMVGEEIHLNEHLEAQGFEVIETDLGEYIVQLRGEPPAHIITPAVHLNREQVARTFEEKLGLPFTTDIPTLTAAARKVLRTTFLTAGIGISGVNFGIAETGTLVIVTNEGNGRMCTTLPGIHIALMGIERLLPRMDDLAFALDLLPRSATGQKLSVYTSLIHSPRRPGESDGPTARHLVLIDNGRSRLRSSPLSEALYCIRCGACLNACPVFREIGGHAYRGLNGEITPYPGPIGSVISPALFGVESFGHLARASSLCGACKDACPVNIDLPKLLLRIRYEGGEKAPPAASPDPQQNPAAAPRRSQVPAGLRIGLQLFSWFARSKTRFQLAQRMGGFFSRWIPNADGWMRLPDFSGWGYRRDFPRLALQPFSESRFAKELKSTPGQHHPLRKTAPYGHALSASPIALGKGSVSPSKTGLSERFTQELLSLGGSVRLCREDNLIERILAFLQEVKVEKVQAWEATYLPAGLLEALDGAGIQVCHAADPAIRLGLTGALAGIAETGSLVLPASAERPPTASLLPEIHLAVLHSRVIHERLNQALNLPEIRQASTVSIITGPSRTADIEMTLTIGVHGPRQLVVFLVDEI